MVTKSSTGEKVFDAFNVILMILLMVVTIYPLYYVVVASFSEPSSIFESRGLLLFPVNPTLHGYKLVFSSPNVLLGLRNSVLYVVLGTSINLVTTIIGGYVLSRPNLLWKKPLMVFIVVTMYFSGGLIPFYMVVQTLGMINSIWAVVVPRAISTWNLIIMRTAFSSIPPQMEESAKIDGASHIRILVKIMIPLSIPTIAVMLLFYSVGHWNSWFDASIFLRDRAMYPLQLFLREILLMNVEVDPDNLTIGTDIQGVLLKSLVKYAIITVSTIPILFVYPFIQKYFIKGMFVGSLKQ